MTEQKDSNDVDRDNADDSAFQPKKDAETQEDGKNEGEPSTTPDTGTEG